MRYQRHVGALVAACALCAALAGCGSVVASGNPGGPATAAAPPAPRVGCASVSQATAVTVRRTSFLVKPVRIDSISITERKPALVRALFGDLCSAVAHPYHFVAPVNCPAAFPVNYAGTFYDGHTVLATFTYAATGCRRVSVTAAGKTQATMVLGRAAAAAPHLMADMDTVLGLKPGVMQPLGAGASSLRQVGSGHAAPRMRCLLPGCVLLR